jgi:hypothetical protein
MIKNLIQKIESKILTKLFMRWIDNEYDLELLCNDSFVDSEQRN